MLGQELGDLDIMAVFFPLEIVLYQDDCLLGRTTDPVELAVGSALLDWRDPDFRFLEPWKMNPRLPEKQVRFCSRCRCH